MGKEMRRETGKSNSCMQATSMAVPPDHLGGGRVALPMAGQCFC